MYKAWKYYLRIISLDKDKNEAICMLDKIACVHRKSLMEARLYIVIFFILLRPINDSYGIIEFELVSEIQDGLLSRKIKQVVLGTAEILVADLLSYHSDNRFINL